MGSPAWWLLDVEAACLRLGQPSVLRRVVAPAPYSSPWLEACAAAADEDFVRAAEVYEEIGALSEAALARPAAANKLAAAGRREEAETQLERAVVFFRRAGATLYLRQAEALLPASV